MTIIRIKRHVEDNTAPIVGDLVNAELAFNEVSKTLYYGAGEDANGKATEVVTIGGEAAMTAYVAKAGDTMTGALSLPAAVWTTLLTPAQAVNKQWLDWKLDPPDSVILGPTTRLSGGGATGAGGSGGAVTVRGGAGGPGGLGGRIDITSGSSSGPTSSSILIQAGESTNATLPIAGGDVYIRGGVSVSNAASVGGNVILEPGQGAGVAWGDIIIPRLKTTAQAADVVWNNAGVLNIGAGATASADFLPLTGGTLTGNIAFDRPAGTEAAIDSTVGGLMRWRVALGNNTPETPEGQGTDFTISRFANDGIPIDTVLNIGRQSGVVDFKFPPTVEGVPLVGDYLPITGGTLSGSITVATPTDSLGAYQIGLTIGDPANAQGAGIQFLQADATTPAWAITRGMGVLNFVCNTGGAINNTILGLSPDDIWFAKPLNITLGARFPNGSNLTMLGDILMESGDISTPPAGVGSDGIGQTLTISSGNGDGVGDGGSIYLIPGAGGATGKSGTILLYSLPTVAQPVNTVWNNNGVLNIGAGGTSGGGDFLPLTGGTMTGDITLGTAADIRTPNAPTGIALPINIISGNSLDTVANVGGGPINITAGKGRNSADVRITAGEASAFDGGDVRLYGGESGAIRGGHVYLYGGDGASAGGSVVLTPGNLGTPEQGEISFVLLRTIPHTTDTNAVWNNNGVLNIGAGATYVDAIDDAAAAAAGVALNGIYHNAGVMRIRIV